MRYEITQRRVWFLLGGVMMFLLGVVGCGGEEAAAPAPTLAPTTVAPTAEAAEADPEAAATETAVPPTATAAATETAAPATATSAPTATAETADTGATASGQTACDHPYLPLREGATWTYTDGSQDYVWTVQSVTGDAAEATAVLQIAIDDVTINYDWRCSAEEGLTSFDFANLSLAQTDFDMNLALEEGSGQFLPPAEELELGYTWQISYTNNLSFTQEAGGTTITATGDMMVDETNEVIGTEPVTLDNGVTADAIQVAQSDTITLDINVMEQTTTQTVSLSGTHTFAEGIGMVRQTTESDFGGNELVLVSYDIP